MYAHDTLVVSMTVRDEVVWSVQCVMWWNVKSEIELLYVAVREKEEERGD